MPKKSKKTLEQPLPANTPLAAQLITSLAASIVAQVSSFSNGGHREDQRQSAIEGGLR